MRTYIGEGSQRFGCNHTWFTGVCIYRGGSPRFVARIDSFSMELLLQTESTRSMLQCISFERHKHLCSALTPGCTA